jgi:hypothetical protein
MKRHLHVIVPLLILIGCVVAGVVQGGRRADQVMASAAVPVKEPTRYRAEVQSRFITGNLIIGVPLSFIAYFALRPFARRKQRQQRPQNQPSQPIAGKPGSG